MKCRRCGEERQTLIWKTMSENEMWRVCPQCLDAIEWAERKMSQLNELKCEHYDGEKCTLFPKCVFPDCRYYVTVEEC